MYNFTKEERLCSKKLLDKLFHSGSSFLIYPFRIVHLKEPLADSLSAQVVIGVPKRKFKKSVDRNLIRRRIREAYRLNKELSLYAVLRDNNVQILFSINYVGKEILSYSVIEKKLLLALKQLTKVYVPDPS